MKTNSTLLLALALSLLISALSLRASSLSSPLTDAQIETLLADYQKRKMDFFLRQPTKSPSTKQIQKNWKNRGDFTRGYNLAVALFSMRAFHLDENLPEANAALREMCQYHLDRPEFFMEYHSFPWVCDAIVRITKFFGPNGSIAPNRVTPETHALIMKTAWEWSREKAKIADAEYKESKTWWFYATENHHAQHISTAWAFAMLLKDEPAYRDRKYDDGHTPAEHHAAWTHYLREYLRQRASKGMTLEIDSPAYAATTLKCIYGLHDFTDDPILKKNAGQWLDLYWAMWAQQQIDGAHGGGKTRSYPGSSQQATGDFARRAAWYLFGVGTPEFTHASMIPFVTTTWKPPHIIMDMIYDREGRGACEVRERRMGLAVPGFQGPGHYRLRTDFGGILRYAYATPDFVMGSLCTEARPTKDWIAISAQNRWAGAIFRGDPDARVYAVPVQGKDSTILNGFWTAQSRGTLITQKLKAAGRNAAWRVFFSKPGLTPPLADGNWYFAEAEAAFVGVRVVQGGATLLPDEPKARGRWLSCEDTSTPTIIEVARKTPEMPTLDAFRKAVKALPLKLTGSVLAYTSLAGDRFTFHTDESRLPEINGKPVNLAPEKVYDSPFIQSQWDSGKVTIQKGTRKLELDFNY